MTARAPKKTADVLVTPPPEAPAGAPLADVPESVIDRLKKKPTHCKCGAPTTSGKCEHPEIEGEDVIDLKLVEGAPLIHNNTTVYWRFKGLPPTPGVPTSAEAEQPAAGLEGCIARYADGCVRIWSPKQPGRITVVPMTAMLMFRVAAKA